MKMENKKRKPIANKATSEAKRWQRIAHDLIFPSVVVVPLWFGMGRSLFGISGWGIISLTIIALFTLVPYHIILIILSWAGKRAYLSKPASVLLFVYLVLQVVVQMAFLDAGDTPERSSVLTAIGASESLNDTILGIGLSAMIIVMAALLIVLTVDAINNRRAKSTA